jgi:endonuclease/exonuclease/phosphatase family metal-dependent hydrolase
MKSFVLLFLTYILNNFSSTAQIGSIATYNIRYDGHTDLANDWVERKVPIAQFVLNNHIDIIGFQEVLHNQLLDLQVLLPNYKHVGVGRDDGKTQGEFAPIFYDSTKYTAVQSGTFWLSPTPQMPSKGWDAALNRICTFVLFKENNGGELTWVFNTHFDHIGVEARLHSADLILDQIAEFLQAQDAPVLLIGDFNMEDTDVGIELIRARFKDFSCVKIPDQKRRKKNNEICFPPTFNGFTAATSDDKRIDYIFGSDRIIPFKCNVDTTTFGLSYPSDHFPVLVHFLVLR